MSDEQPQRTEIGYANHNPLIFDHSAASSFADICQRALRELKFLLPDLLMKHLKISEGISLKFTGGIWR